MSILMTANSRKTRGGAKKKANAARKASRVPYLAEGSTPAYSDETTSVWYWVLDGNATTLTYNKTKNEVRCNGFILEAYDGFIEGDDDDLDAADVDDDDFDAGGVIDFAIFVAESQTSHEGRLIRLHASPPVPASSSSSSVGGLRTHDLYVDGFLIPEHIEGAYTDDVPDSACLLHGDSGNFEYAEDGSGNQFRFEEQPPAYNSAIHGDWGQNEPPW